LEETNYLDALNPGAKILYITHIPTTNEPRDSFNINLCEKLEVEFKKKDHVFVLELGEELRRSSNWNADYLSDGLHMNDEGVRLMGDLIAEKIKTIRTISE